MFHSPWLPSVGTQAFTEAKLHTIWPFSVNVKTLLHYKSHTRHFRPQLKTSFYPFEGLLPVNLICQFASSCAASVLFTPSKVPVKFVSSVYSTILNTAEHVFEFPSQQQRAKHHRHTHSLFPTLNTTLPALSSPGLLSLLGVLQVHIRTTSKVAVCSRVSLS